MIEYEMIKEFNKYLCEISNEPFGIKDNNLLKSVSVSAEQEVFGQKLYPSIEHKISYIVTSIIKNHMFINANKRTACMVYEYLCEKYNITPINDNSLEINILKIVKNKFDINYSIKLLFNKIIKEENMENKKVLASYRIALGQIKRYFGDSKPTEKEVKKIAVEIAKRNKLNDTEFFMKWALGQIGTVNEDLDEKTNLSAYSDVIAKMTDNNEHMEVRLLMAKIIDDKRLIELVKATNNIIDYERSNPISTYTNKVYDYLNTAGRKKFGKADWDKYIYSNT